MRVVITLFLAAALAGCLQTPQSAPEPPAELSATSWTDPAVGDSLRFSIPRIIDEVRAGGEPVIASVGSDALVVAAHAGHTQFSPDGDMTNFVAANRMEAYAWYTTDAGATWHTPDLAGLPVGTRQSNAIGYSDPDLAVDGQGRVWLVDLLPFFEVSVIGSSDGGQTWDLGGPMTTCAPYFADRPWLAADDQGVYFYATSFSGQAPCPLGEIVLYSQDGTEWEVRGAPPCNLDPVFGPDGVLYQACGTWLADEGEGGIAWSEDGGVTWDEAPAPVVCSVCEPALAANGTIYMAGHWNDTIALTFTEDRGATWAEPLGLERFFPAISAEHVSMWPWTVATERGAAVFFISAQNVADYRDMDAEWRMYAVLIERDSANVTVHPWTVTPEPFHRGQVCKGTFCQVLHPDLGPGEFGDRRVGEFFEATVGDDGRLAVVFTDTASDSDDAVGHVAFAIQEPIDSAGGEDA